MIIGSGAPPQIKEFNVQDPARAIRQNMPRTSGSRHIELFFKTEMCKRQDETFLFILSERRRQSYDRRLTSNA